MLSGVLGEFKEKNAQNPGEVVALTHPSLEEITYRKDYRSPGRLEYKAKVEKCQGMKKAQGHTPNNRR